MLPSPVSNFENDKIKDNLLWVITTITFEDVDSTHLHAIPEVMQLVVWLET